MNTRVTFVLMIVFLVLSSFAFFDPLHLREKRHDRQEQEGHVFWLKDERLERLLVKAGTQSFAFECATEGGCPFDGSGDWKIVAPVQDRADASVLGSVTAAIKNLAVVDRLQFDGTQPDPQEFGIPQTSLSVEMKAVGVAEPYVLHLGGAVPTGPQIYAQTSRAPQTIYLVGNSLPGQLKQDLFYWRNKRLFPTVKADKLSTISWAGGPAGTVSAARGPGGWNLTAPVVTPANGVMLEGLANTLAYAAAKSIYEAAPAAAKKLKAGKPRFEVSFAPAGEPGSSLKLYQAPGLPEGSLVASAAGQDSLFVVEANPFDRFQKDLASYRDGRLFPGKELFDVDRMELHFPRGGQAVALLRKGDDWSAADAAKLPEPLSQDRIRAFFEMLGGAEAKDYLSGGRPEVAAFRKGPPDVEVKLFEKEKLLASARFLLSERKYALTAGANEGEVRRYEGDFLKALPIRPQDLYASSNKQVITQEKEVEHGHEHHHAH